MFTVEFEVDGNRRVSQFKRVSEAENMFDRLCETTGVKYILLLDYSGNIIRRKGYVYGN